MKSMLDTDLPVDVIQLGLKFLRTKTRESVVSAGLEFRSIMKFRTWLRLRIMSKTEKEKRLDELNRKLRQPSVSIGTHLEELEEREWLKKKLGYGAL